MPVGRPSYRICLLREALRQGPHYFGLTKIGQSLHTPMAANTGNSRRTEGEEIIMAEEREELKGPKSFRRHTAKNKADLDKYEKWDKAFAAVTLPTENQFLIEAMKVEAKELIWTVVS